MAMSARPEFASTEPRIAPRRVAAAIAGDGLRPELRAPMAVSLMAAASLVGFSAYSGVWAVRALGATAQQLGWMLLGAALVATAVSYLAGRVSDRFGRRRVIVMTLTTHALAVGVLVAVGQRLLVGLAIAALAWVASAATWPQLTALVADAAAKERRDPAFAAARVAETIGMTAGPGLASVLLLAGGWPGLLLGIAVLDLAGATVAVPARAADPPARGESAKAVAAPPARLFADRRFVALFASTFFGFAVFVALETVLPIVAVSDYRLAPAVWGAVFLVNPLLAVLFQVPLTARLSGRRIDAKLAAAMLLMGWSFLLLLLDTSLPAIALVVLLAAVGDVIWVPTRQSLAIELAGRAARGAYVGALGAAGTLAWAAAPPAAFAVRAGGGDHALWLAVAGVATVAAALGVVADRAPADEASRAAPGPSRSRRREKRALSSRP